MIQPHCCLAAVFDVDVDPFQKKKKERLKRPHTKNAYHRIQNVGTVSIKKRTDTVLGGWERDVTLNWPIFSLLHQK